MEPSEPESSRPAGAPCRVGLAGFGTVGRAVARILCENPPTNVRLTHIFNRNVERKKVDWVPGHVRWTDQIDDLIAGPVDVLVELVGGVEPAGDWVTRALEAGKSVVTANKQLMAQRGSELTALARRRRCHLRFEASVAGGIPIICSLRDGLAGDHISGISGILNGTCNFVLTSMENAGASFDDALRQAQEHGYAEADPTDDVEGYDARAKLAILCAVALQADVQPRDIATKPITLVDAVDFAHARRLGCTIRQVSQAQWDREGGCLRVAVRPALVPVDSALARVTGSQNIIVLRGCYGGETVFSGHGAGGGPTSVAVVSDLAAVARQDPERDLVSTTVRPTDVSGEFVTPHYLRFVVRDRPGIIASIAGAMDRYGINIDAVLQLPAPSKSALPFVVTVEACAPTTLSQAMYDIGRLDFHVEPPIDLPILEGGQA
jgi:homoserine dehydrogenase